MSGSVDIILTCPDCHYTGHGTQTYDGYGMYHFFSGGRRGECPNCGSWSGTSGNHG